ncbi:MAG TPA: hypothetical protein VF022_03770 [Rhodanobacteraceae bacterium]|jgi:hypothetical protein
MKPRALVLAILMICGGAARAQDFQLHGFLDFRAVSPPGETSWDDGGLGKSRYGNGDGGLHAGAAVLDAHWQVAPVLSAVADLQYQPDEHRHLDVLDAYLRLRPASITPWRWSLKVGAFFAPISLENEGIGWTSLWTLTPSAINSWIGEELRTVGGEFDIEHRGAGTFQAGFAVFGKNDPAGELLATRGWSLSDLTSGLRASVREPDVYAPLVATEAPVDYRPFDEIDHRPGWYADASWESPAYGKVALLRYDNRADPQRYEHYDDRRVFAWHTRFWSLGARTRIGDVALIAQAMDGDTAFEPVPELYLDTHFRSAFLLAGWERGAWRPALRFDVFSLRQTPSSLPNPLSEHGNALTAALNWRPNDRLRITGEWLRIDSTRDQRTLEGLAPRRIDRQVQLSARVYF